MNIVIKTSSFEIKATLNDSISALKFAQILPIEGSAKIWGNEIYFPIPMEDSISPNGSTEVEEGELAFWPDGNMFCIFFGLTPESDNGKPKAISPVNVLGKITGDYTTLKAVNGNEIVRIEKV